MEWFAELYLRFHVVAGAMTAAAMYHYLYHWFGVGTPARLHVPVIGDRIVIGLASLGLGAVSPFVWLVAMLLWLERRREQSSSFSVPFLH